MHVLANFLSHDLTIPKQEVTNIFETVRDSVKQMKLAEYFGEFENKTDMHRHAKEIHGLEEKGHKCPHCFKLFPSSQQLGQHSLVHTNIRKYTCKFCDKTFKQLSHVQQHQRIHTGEKPYKCPGEGCEKAFAQLSNLQNHMKQHEKETNGSGPRDLKKPFSCHVCQRRFATESSLNNHISKLHSAVAQPHDLTCQVCEKQCYSTDKFYKHMHKYHPDYWRVFAGDRPLSDFINPEIRQREKPFMCQICNKKYSHETGLSKHLITHPEYRNDPNFKGAELFNCPVCEKFFTRENYLERHMEMKHDEEHARAYEIYKQKYIRKPQPPIENAGDQAVPVLDRPPTLDARDNHISSHFTLDNGGHPPPPPPLPPNVVIPQAVQPPPGGMRSETISRPPPESPSDSEIEDANRRKQQQEHLDSRASLPSHSESFHGDASFERTSPSRQQQLPPMAHRESNHWPEPNSARASPRGFSDTQHQPYDMSQRQEMMASKSHNGPQRSASVSLPVFPEPFDRHLKDKDSPDDPSRPPHPRSYLHRQMASLDEEQLRPSSNYVERQMSAHESQQVSYEQFVRDHLMEDHRTSEKIDYSQRNSHNKQGLSRNELYMRPQISSESDDRRIPDNYFPQHRESIDEHGQDEYLDRSRSISKTTSPDSNTHISVHDDHSQIDRHFPYSRSPGHDSVRTHPSQEHHPPRLLAGNEDSRYDYPPYNAHGLLSPGHGGLGRDRLSGQFPFNLPPSSLPPSSFTHPMSPRPSLGGQYPPLGHRSEEEVAQALESLARAMRPAFR